MGGLTSRAAGPLRGRGLIPGDKSISHRALLFGAVAVGETVIHDLLEADDVLAAAAAIGALGVDISRDSKGPWRIDGVGVGGLAEPSGILDLRNSGTAARLLMGVLATHNFTSHLTGDRSLVRRPMARVAEPLQQMGAEIVARSGCRLPLAISGTPHPTPITYRLPVPSAQVKSAVLFAGLNTPGNTVVIEPQPTRDHSETMLRHFGADIAVEADDDGARAITLHGLPELTGRDVRVPRDPSSAAFPLVGALICRDSEVVLPGVNVNPSRFGLVETLLEMGGSIVCEGRRDKGWEPVADLKVRNSALVGVDVPAERAPRLIDEYPALAAAAACATGPTVLRGLAELRVKESDRLSALAGGLTACGVKIEVDNDDLIIHGTGAAPQGGASVDARFDHRIAMAFLTLGLVTRAPISVLDASAIETSFPEFVDVMNGLGAAIATDPRDT